MQLSGLFWNEANMLFETCLKSFHNFILSWTVHSMIWALVEAQEYPPAFWRILLSGCSLENVILFID